jgi:CRISPR-associated protein Csc3
MTTDFLNIFSLANKGLRRNQKKRSTGDQPTAEEVERYWQYAQLWAQGDKRMDDSVSLIEQLVSEYWKFYRVNSGESSHAILLPLSIALDYILSVPSNISLKDVIVEGSGQIQKALDRREVYRPILMDKSSGLDYSTRVEEELSAIQTFMTTCVEVLFKQDYKRDHALLQENQNRIKAGAEFAYRRLALKEYRSKAKNSQPKGDKQ